MENSFHRRFNDLEILIVIGFIVTMIYLLVIHIEYIDSQKEIIENQEIIINILGEESNEIK